MSMNIWDLCQLDVETNQKLDELENETKKIHVNTKIDVPSSSSSSTLALTTIGQEVGINQNILHLQQVLTTTDDSCRQSLRLLDTVLLTIHSIKEIYYDVTGRTNNLMAKCESLLEQQQTYQNTVEVLNKTLQPFNHIEEVALLLGIPYDNNLPTSVSTPNSNNSTMLTNTTIKPSIDSISIHNIDPRSPEFQDILSKLSNSIVFFKQHPEIMEVDRYRHWLEKLQIRAISLIGRTMRDLLEKSYKQCKDMIQQKLYTSHGNISQNQSGTKSTQGTSLLNDMPIESSPIYQKFRGLSFRMKELLHVLFYGNLLGGSLGSEGSLSSASQDQSQLLSRSASFSFKGKNNIPSLQNPNNLPVNPFGGNQHEVIIIAEVKKAYSNIRVELLQPFLTEAWFNVLLTNSYTSTNLSQHSTSGTNLSSFLQETQKNFSNMTNNSSNSQNNQVSSATGSFISLSTVIRHAFSTLLRVTQLEYQLYESLFGIDPLSSQNATPHTTSANALTTPRLDFTPRHDFSGKSTDNIHISSAAAAANASTQDMQRILESLSNITRDFLRPMIIRETSVDELCRVISALREDIKSQISVLTIPPIYHKQFYNGLEATISDAKERLIYCAEMKLRLEIQTFEPLPSQLAYPEIIETFFQEQKQQIEQSNGSNEIYSTWYPPLRNNLSLLSKLYGIVDTLVFEDFARRSIELCIHTLLTGSQQIKRQNKLITIHGDLFLVRHLLILREQLLPFEINMAITEKHLDFSNTNKALHTYFFAYFSHLLAPSTNTVASPTSTTTPSSTLSQWNRIQQNLFSFAQEGLPSMQEYSVDIKDELDKQLKKSCLTLKLSVNKLLIGPIDSFLAKVTAFIGDIPFAPLQAEDFNSSNSNHSLLSSNSQTPVLTKEQIDLLKGQSFVKADRMKEMFENLSLILVNKVQEIKEMMQLYIENPTTRQILLKSFMQEYEITRRKMECIMINCIDPGQSLRELEQLLTSVTKTIVKDLN